MLAPRNAMSPRAAMPSPFRATPPARSIRAPTALTSPPRRTPERSMPPRTSAPRSRMPPRASKPSASTASPSGEAIFAPSASIVPPARTPRSRISPVTVALQMDSPPRASSRSACRPGNSDPSRNRLSITAERSTGEASKRQSVNAISRGIRQPSRSSVPVTSAPLSLSPFSCTRRSPSPARMRKRRSSARTIRVGSFPTGHKPFPILLKSPDPKPATTLASAAWSGWKSARLRATAMTERASGAFPFVGPASVWLRFRIASVIWSSRSPWRSKRAGDRAGASAERCDPANAARTGAEAQSC